VRLYLVLLCVPGGRLRYNAFVLPRYWAVRVLRSLSHHADEACSACHSNKLRAHTSILLGATIRMAQPRAQAQKPLLTQEQLKKKLEISNFEPNSILRGAQLTVVGGQYALPCIINMPGPPADQIQL
jgi:hypothetical protein